MSRRVPSWSISMELWSLFQYKFSTSDRQAFQESRSKAPYLLRSSGTCLSCDVWGPNTPFTCILEERILLIGFFFFATNDWWGIVDSFGIPSSWSISYNECDAMKNYWEVRIEVVFLPWRYLPPRMSKRRHSPRETNSQPCIFSNFFPTMFYLQFFVSHFYAGICWWYVSLIGIAFMFHWRSTVPDV